jgi:hypothetical protein
MQNKIVLKKQLLLLRTCIVTLVLVFISLLLFSFTAQHLANDFLKQLGITKTTAEEKISGTMLSGSFDAHGVKNAKGIPAAIRATVAKEALAYTKQYISTPAFTRQYIAMKESNKPVFKPLQTPEEMQNENSELYRKAVQDAEKSLAKADGTMKPVFETVLAEAKKQQKQAEDPNSKYYANYRKNYEGGVKANQQSYDRQLAEWEQQYPANHMLYIKQRLEQFMKETEGIDFTAATALKNGKQVFINPQYERKSNRWKMAYRAGGDVVETSRDFIQQWISEIKTGN